MKLERIDVQQCCKTRSISFKIEKSINKNFIAYLVGKGFIESKHFTNAGMLYIEDASVVASGTFGNNIINLKCKVRDCDSSINNFEKLLADME